jgi:hypothetical protein
MTNKNCDCIGAEYLLTATNYVLCLGCGNQYAQEGFNND